MTGPDGTPSPGLAAASWCLRIGLAVQCVGLASSILFIEFTDPTPVNKLLAIELQSETAARIADLVTGWGMLAAAAWILVRPGWKVAAPVAVWFAALAVVKTYRGGSYLSEITLAAHGSRILAPVALGLLAASRVEAASWVLRVAAAATFVAHGAKAIAVHFDFVDLVLGSGMTLGLDISEEGARTALRIIGVVDIGVAILLLSRRWRFVALYMAVWGLITAVSRITGKGLASYDLALIRCCNAAVPLAVFLIWRAARPALPSEVD